MNINSRGGARRIFGGGLQLPSKEFEIQFYKPKLFLNQFSNYIRLVEFNFQIFKANYIAILEGRGQINAKTF